MGQRSKPQPEKTPKKPATLATRKLNDSDTMSSGLEEVYPIEKHPKLRKNPPRDAKNTLEEVILPRSSPRIKYTSTSPPHLVLSYDDDGDDDN